MFKNNSSTYIERYMGHFMNGILQLFQNSSLYISSITIQDNSVDLFLELFQKGSKVCSRTFLEQILCPSLEQL